MRVRRRRETREPRDQASRRAISQRTSGSDTRAAERGRSAVTFQRDWREYFRARPLFLPLALVTLVLVTTIDDRHVGRAADERQLIWTAVALAETGQLSQALEHDFTYLSPDGRAVSRFGIGMSLLEVPAAWLAPAVEGVMGAGSSQPLFLVAPMILVLAAAAFAGRAARALGANVAGQMTAVILVGLGSPFGTYAAAAFSEPLQGAALVAAYALALTSAAAADEAAAKRRACAAGFAVSWALLAKSSMIVVAPVMLLPLLSTGSMSERMRRASVALLGFVPGLALWVWVELLRFGRLFGSYPGEAMNHPVWDGIWRLVVGPNLGFIWFFPALTLAVWASAHRLMPRGWKDIGQIAPIIVGPAMLLVLAAGWWAWHGVWGWGPRLLVPAVPVLAAGAATVLQGWSRPLRGAFVAVSILFNAPGFLQHHVPVAAYISNLAWPAVPEKVAQSLASYARRIDADGAFRISPDHVLATVPQASQFIVFPWFFWANCCAAAGPAAALATPPWQAVRPDLIPVQSPMSEALLRAITGHPRARFWGRGFYPSANDARYAAVYDEALADQILRLQQLGDGASALALAEKLVRLAPFGSNDALVPGILPGSPRSRCGGRLPEPALV